MSTAEKLNKIANSFFKKTYAELSKSQRDIAFEQYLKEYAITIKR
jgi:hypothetical protein